MTRIIHVSDLHFGYDRSELVEPLARKLEQLGGDLVIVTGDVSHRARPAQFRNAGQLLSKITAPVMVVPGNHDVPLYHLFRRFLNPYGGYREAINAELAPTRQVGNIRVIGLNTVNPFSWRRGKIDLDHVRRAISGIDPQMINIVALHHPLQQLPGVEKSLAKGAEPALDLLEDAGVQIVLSGHIHEWTAVELLELGPHNGILQIQAGAALCNRLTDVQNEIAVLDFAGSELIITRFIAGMGENRFAAAAPIRLTREAGQWQVIST